MMNNETDESGRPWLVGNNGILIGGKIVARFVARARTHGRVASRFGRTSEAGTNKRPDFFAISIFGPLLSILDTTFSLFFRVAVAVSGRPTPLKSLRNSRRVKYPNSSCSS